MVKETSDGEGGVDANKDGQHRVVHVKWRLYLSHEMDICTAGRVCTRRSAMM